MAMIAIPVMVPRLDTDRSPAPVIMAPAMMVVMTMHAIANDNGLGRSRYRYTNRGGCRKRQGNLLHMSSSGNKSVK